MRRETNGWHAGFQTNFGVREIALYLGRARDRDTWENATVDETGRLVMTVEPIFTEATRPLLYLPWGADIALAEAFADRSPDAEWKARAEERQTALDREVARVDRILGEHR